ncbi:MAG: hypothetical protein AAB427_15685, partial [Chloroflexota bacterium]
TRAARSSPNPVILRWPWPAPALLLLTAMTTHGRTGPARLPIQTLLSPLAHRLPEDHATLRHQPRHLSPL